MSHFEYFSKNILYKHCTSFSGHSHIVEGKEFATTICFNSHLYLLILYTYDSLPKQVKIVVTLYTLIWEAINLNLDRNTDYPEVFCLLPRSLQANSGEVPRLGYNCILTNIFQFTSHAHPNIQHSMLWDNENIVQQTTKENKNLKWLS